MYFFFPQESDETGTDSDSSDSDEIGMDEPDQRVEMPSGSGGLQGLRNLWFQHCLYHRLGQTPRRPQLPKLLGLSKH